jgi:cupin superfamily acireductone dioxygenase involved in methionine salvage
MNPFPQRYGDDNQNISIVARKGDIVIFPADIYHYVMPNPKDEDRISISMNLRLC